MVLLVVAFGGALGAVTRYLLAVRLYNTLGIDFPYGTLGVNVIGSFLLGVILGLIEERGAFSQDTRSFLTVGFLGGMTTFSTFAYEGWQMSRDGEIVRTGLYVIASVAGALLAFTIGFALTRVLAR
jgi:fluoride exporter